MIKKSAFVLASILAASQAIAGPCGDKPVEKDILVTATSPAIGPYPVIAGFITETFDYAKQTVCFRIQGNPKLGIKLTPDNACIDMSTDTPDGILIKLLWADGSSENVAQTTKESLRPVYEKNKTLCGIEPEGKPT